MADATLTTTQVPLTGTGVSCPSAMSIPDFFGGFLRCFRSFGVFFELVFHTDLHLKRKRRGNEVLTRVLFF